jgi:hypothetical protein
MVTRDLCWKQQSESKRGKKIDNRSLLYLLNLFICHSIRMNTLTSLNASLGMPPFLRALEGNLFSIHFLSASHTLNQPMRY